MDYVMRLLRQMLAGFQVAAKVLRATADVLDVVDDGIAKVLGVSKKKESKEKIYHE